MTTSENPPPPPKSASTPATLPNASNPSPYPSVDSDYQKMLRLKYPTPKEKALRILKNALTLESVCLSLIVITLVLVFQIKHQFELNFPTLITVGIAFSILAIPIGTLVLKRHYQNKLDSSSHQTHDSIAQVNKIHTLNIIRRTILSIFIAAMLLVIALCGLILLLLSVCHGTGVH